MNYAFWKAIRNGDKAVVEAGLREGMDPNALSPFLTLFTPVVEACFHNQAHLLPCLKRFGATIPSVMMDPHTGNAKTLMTLAWAYDNEEMAEFLYENNPEAVSISIQDLAQMPSFITRSKNMRRWWLARQLPLDFHISKDAEPCERNATLMKGVLDAWCVCGFADRLTQNLAYLPMLLKKAMHAQGVESKTIVQAAVEGAVMSQDITSIELLSRAFPEDVVHYPLLWKAVQKNAGLVITHFSHTYPFQDTFERQWGAEATSEMFKQCMDAARLMPFSLFQTLIQAQPNWDYTKTNLQQQSFFQLRFEGRYHHQLRMDEEIQWMAWLLEFQPTFFQNPDQTSGGFLKSRIFKVDEKFWQGVYDQAVVVYEKSLLSKLDGAGGSKSNGRSPRL